MSANFELYFSLAEIAERIPKTDQFWRAEFKAGAFGPLERCLQVGGEYFVPASGVAYYLDSHKIPAAAFAHLVNGRHRQASPARAVLSGGITARSAGELRRKLVQTPEHEPAS